MVSFVNMGRLGNWLFETATTIGYALKHNIDFTVPATTRNPKWDPVYFPHLVNPNYNPRLQQVKIFEKGHQYQELPFEESWRHKNIFLQGYWQSEKYFKDYREDILKAFNLPWNPHNDVSIHVRRGDYLQYPEKHPIVPHEYYVSAIEFFRNKGYKNFHVFSDDLSYCREYFEFFFRHKCGFKYSRDKTELEDLVGISNCAAGHISSSSTFGWWGAWLNQNPNKIVITPKLWFVPGHNNLDVSDIVPSNWIKI